MLLHGTFIMHIHHFYPFSPSIYIFLCMTPDWIRDNIQLKLVIRYCSLKEQFFIFTKPSNHLGGLMVNFIANRRLFPSPVGSNGQTKDLKIDICCSPAKHTAVNRVISCWHRDMSCRSAENSEKDNLTDSNISNYSVIWPWPRIQGLEMVHTLRCSDRNETFVNYHGLIKSIPIKLT